MADVIKMYCDEPKYSLANVAQSINRSVDGENICTEVKNDGTAIMVVLEKYYFRTGGYVSLSVLLTEENGHQYATLVGSGGGQGLFNFSWGANGSLASDAAEELEDYGFTEL